MSTYIGFDEEGPIQYNPPGFIGLDPPKKTHLKNPKIQLKFNNNNHCQEARLLSVSNRTFKVIKVFDIQGSKIQYFVKKFSKILIFLKLKEFQTGTVFIL